MPHSSTNFSKAYLAGKELIKEAEKHLEKLKTMDLSSSAKKCQEELADQAEIMKDELRTLIRFLFKNRIPIRYFCVQKNTNMAELADLSKCVGTVVI